MHGPGEVMLGSRKQEEKVEKSPERKVPTHAHAASLCRKLPNFLPFAILRADEILPAADYIAQNLLITAAIYLNILSGAEIYGL